MTLELGVEMGTGDFRVVSSTVGFVVVVDLEERLGATPLVS